MPVRKNSKTGKWEHITWNQLDAINKQSSNDLMGPVAPSSVPGPTSPGLTQTTPIQGPPAPDSGSRSLFDKFWNPEIKSGIDGYSPPMGEMFNPSGLDSITGPKPQPEQSSSIGSILKNWGNEFTTGVGNTFNDAKWSIRDLILGRPDEPSILSDPSFQDSPTMTKIFGNMGKGVQDIAESAGGFANHLGYENDWAQAAQANKAEMNQYVPDRNKDFTWSDLADPDFYATSVARTLPSMLAPLPGAVAGWKAASAAGKAAGLGTFGRTVLGALGGSAVSAPFEAAMESGSVYNEALARKMDPAQAHEAADSVFKKNLAMLGITNAAELGLAFAPLKGLKAFNNLGTLGKTALGAGKVVGGGLMEGGQEVVQDVFQRQALNDPIAWDAQMKEGFAVGAILGGGMGAVGAVNDHLATLTNNVKNRYNDKLQQLHDYARDEAKQTGMTDDDAEKHAFDMVAATDAGKQIITEAVDELKTGAMNQEIVMAPANVDAVIGKQPKQEPVANPLQTPTNTPAQPKTDNPAAQSFADSDVPEGWDPVKANVSDNPVSTPAANPTQDAPVQAPKQKEPKIDNKPLERFDDTAYRRVFDKQPQAGDLVHVIPGQNYNGLAKVVKANKKEVVVDAPDGKQLTLKPSQVTVYQELKNKDGAKVENGSIKFEGKEMPLSAWYGADHGGSRRAAAQSIWTNYDGQDNADELTHTLARAVKRHQTSELADLIHKRLSLEGVSFDEAISEMEDRMRAKPAGTLWYKDFQDLLNAVELAKERYGEIDPSKKQEIDTEKESFLWKQRFINSKRPDNVDPVAYEKLVEWMQIRNVSKAYKDGRFKQALLNKEIHYDNASHLLSKAAIDDKEIDQIRQDQMDERVKEIHDGYDKKLATMSDLDVKVEAIDSRLGSYEDRWVQKQIDQALATGGKKEGLKVLTKEFRNGGSSGGMIGYDGFRVKGKWHIEARDGREFNLSYSEVLNLYLEHIYEGDALDKSEQVNDALDEVLSKYGTEGRKAIEKAADEYNEKLPVGSDEDPEEIDLLDMNDTSKEFVNFFEHFYNAGREGKPMPEKQPGFPAKFGGLFFQAGKKDGKAPAAAKPKDEKKPAAMKVTQATNKAGFKEIFVNGKPLHDVKPTTADGWIELYRAATTEQQLWTIGQYYSDPQLRKEIAEKLGIQLREWADFIEIQKQFVQFFQDQSGGKLKKDIDWKNSQDQANIKLPKELAGAKPNYSYQDKQFQLDFASDLDKALYIVRNNAKRSKRDADYLAWIKQNFMPDESEEKIRSYGEAIRDRIKERAKDAKPGALGLGFMSAKVQELYEKPNTAQMDALTDYVDEYVRGNRDNYGPARLIRSGGSTLIIETNETKRFDKAYFTLTLDGTIEPRKKLDPIDRETAAVVMDLNKFSDERKARFESIRNSKPESKEEKQPEAKVQPKDLSDVKVPDAEIIVDYKAGMQGGKNFAPLHEEIKRQERVNKKENRQQHFTTVEIEYKDGHTERYIGTYFKQDVPADNWTLVKSEYLGIDEMRLFLPKGLPASITTPQPTKEDITTGTPEQRYEAMRKKMALAGPGKWTTKTKVKRLQELKDFAEQHGLEFSDYHQGLLDKFSKQLADETGQTYYYATAKLDGDTVTIEIDPNNKEGETVSFTLTEYDESGLDEVDFVRTLVSEETFVASAAGAFEKILNQRQTKNDGKTFKVGDTVTHKDYDGVLYTVTGYNKKMNSWSVEGQLENGSVHKFNAMPTSLTKMETAAPTAKLPKAHPKIEKARDSLDFLKQAEEAARQRLKDRQNRVLSGLPMDDLVDYAIIGASKIAHKSLDYAEFASEMIEEFGDSLRLFMRAIHAQSQAVLEMSPDEIDEMIQLANKETDNQVEKQDKEPAPEYASEKDRQMAELKAEIESIDNMIDDMISSLAADLEENRKQALKDANPLWKQIKDKGGIAPSKTRGMKTEYKDSVPLYLKNKNGLPLDEMADELGMSERELLDQLRNSVKYKSRTDGREMSAREAATSMLALDESYLGLERVKGELWKSLRQLRSGVSEDEPAELTEKQQLQKLFFAVSPKADELQVIAEKKPRHVLLSFANWKNKSIQKDFLDVVGYRPETVMIDSGAYSFDDSGLWNIIEDWDSDMENPESTAQAILHSMYQSDLGGINGDKRYPDLLKPYQNTNFWKFFDFWQASKGTADYFINMDEVGSQEMSDYAYRFLKGLGMEPVPVITYPASVEEAQKYIDEGAELIALGGTKNASGRNEKADWARQFVEQYPDVKFHFLGTQDARIIAQVPGLFSADGGAWRENAQFPKNRKPGQTKQDAMRDNVDRMESTLETAPKTIRPLPEDAAKLNDGEFEAYVKAIRSVIQKYYQAIQNNALPTDKKGVRKIAEEALGRPPQEDEWSDALEAAIQRYAYLTINSTASLEEKVQQAAELEKLMVNVNRSLEKTDRQQFSTPLPIAQLVHYAADFKGGTVKEGAAGTGSLVYPFKNEANLELVELSPRRAAILKALGFKNVRNENTFKVSDIKAETVIGNPPFKGQNKHKGTAEFAGNPPWKGGWGDLGNRFIAWELKTAAKPGARLVFVTSPGVIDNKQNAEFRKWLKENYTVRAMIKLPPGSYDTRSTEFGAGLIVVDNVKPKWEPIAFDDVKKGDWIAYQKSDGSKSVSTQVYKPFVNGGKQHFAGVKMEPTGYADIHESYYRDQKLFIADPRTIGPGVREPENFTWDALIKMLKPLAEGGTHARTEMVGTKDNPIQESSGNDGAATSDSRIRGSSQEESNAAASTSDGLRGSGQTDRSGSSATGVSGNSVGGRTRTPNDRNAGKNAVSDATGRNSDVVDKGQGSVRKDVLDQSASESGNDEATLRRRERNESRNGSESNVSGTLGYVPKVDFTGEAHRGNVLEPVSMTFVDMPQDMFTDPKYLPHERLMGTTRSIKFLSDVQIEAVMAAKYNYFQDKRGILIADDTGMGKTAEQLGIVADAWHSGRAKRILVVTTKDQVATESFVLENQQFDFGVPLIFVNSETHKNFKDSNVEPSLLAGEKTRKAAEQGREKAAKKGKDKAEYEPLPDQDGAMVMSKYTFADSTYAVREWLDAADGDVLVIMDESHDFSNVQFSQRGEAARMLYEHFHDKGQFVYASATAAENISNLEHLFGLKLWGTDDFGEFRARLAGQDPGTSSGGRRKQNKLTAGMQSGSVFSREIPLAMMEQIVRELKMEGQYVGRALSMEGVDMQVINASLTPKEIGEWNQAVAFIQMVADKIEEHGSDPKQRGRLNSQLVGYMRRISGYYRTKAVIAAMKERMEENPDQRFVLSGAFKSGDNGQPANLMAMINMIPDTETSEASDGTVMDVINEEAVYDKEQLRSILRGENPEYGEKPVPELPSPIDALYEAFGEDKVLAIHGDVPAKERPQIVKMFQRGERPIVYFTSAGATGINLHDTIGNKIVFAHLDYPYDAKTLKQAEGRSNRTGQTTPPEYWYPVLDNSADPKFVGTILARYQAMGALSRGETAEMGGGEMGNFDFVGPIAQEAIFRLVPKLDAEIRGQMFGSWSNEHFTPGEERNDSGVREVVGDKVDPKKMLNAMMMLDYETGRDIYNQYEQAMEEVRQEMESAGGVVDKFETYSGRQLDVVQGAGGIKLRTIQTILSDQQKRRIDTQIAEMKQKVAKSQERLDQELEETVTKLEERLAKYKADYADAEAEASDVMKEYKAIVAANEKLDYKDPQYAENNRKLYAKGDEANKLKRHMEQVRGKMESTQQQIAGFKEGNKDVIDTLPGVSRWRKELEHRKRQLAAAEDKLKMSDKAVLVDGKFATNGLMVPIRDAIRTAAIGIYGENPPTSAMKVELRGYYMEDGEKVVGAVIPTWASHAVGIALDARLKTDSSNADEVWSLVTSGMNVPLEGGMELRWMPKNKDMIVWGMKPRVEKRHREVFEQIKGDDDVVYNPSNNAVVVKTKDGLAKLIAKFPVKAEDITLASTEEVKPGKAPLSAQKEIDGSWIKLYFSGIPSEDVRSRMKKNGFRWTPKKDDEPGYWRGYKNALTDRLADDIVAELNGGDAAAQTFYPLKEEAEGPKVDKKTGDKSVTRSQIITFISKHFKVPVGSGKYQGRARGIFKPFVTAIRTKNFGDFVAIAHELGHRLDKKYRLHEADEYWDELQVLVETNFAVVPEDDMEIVKEGIADFTRLYLMDQAEAVRLAPEFFDFFESVLEEENLKGHMDTLVDMMDTWTGQSARNRVRGAVEVGKKKRQKVSWTKIQTWMFEELEGIDKSVRAIVSKEDRKNLAGKKDPFMLAWASRGVAGRINAFLEFGPVNADGDRVTDGNGDELLGLKEILKSIDDLDIFRDYLVAQRALELHQQGKKLTPISVRDAQEVIRETPQEYKDASAHLYAYQHATLAELVRTGMMTERKALEFRNDHFFYIPFNRVMEDTGERTGGSREPGTYYKRFTNLANPVKRMKETGSSRQIIDPIESIIKNTYIYVSLATRNEAGAAFANLIDSTPDSAFIAEKVKRPQMVTKFDLAEISGALEAAGVDAETVDLGAMAQVFRPMFMPSKSERILAVWRNGTQEFYQIRDEDAYSAFEALDPEPIKLWVKLLSFPNNVLRTGITMSPTFIPKGPIRSIPTMMMQSDSYTTMKDFAFLGKDIATNFYHALTKDEKYWKWASTGGAQSTMLSIEQQYMNGNADKLLKTSWLDMLKNEWKFLYVPTAYKAARHLVESLDGAVRMSEYQKAMEKTGDVVTAAVRSRDVDMDFLRLGNQTKTPNRISLFFNVALQGPHKTLRTIRQHPLRTLIRGSLFIALPTLLLMLQNMDDEEYWELPTWRRDLFWNIKFAPGKFLMVPIPFEWGLIFKTVPERLIGKYYKHDPQAFKDYWKNAAQTMLPSVLPTFLVGYLQWKTEKNLGTGIPTVPMKDANKPEYMQYGPMTSETAKLIGKVIDASPRKIDDLIKSYTGTMGEMGTRGVDKFLLATGMSKKPPMPTGEKGFFARTFTGSPYGSSSKNVDQFYDRLDEMEKGYKELQVQHPEAKGNPPAALRMMRQANDRMAAMRSIKELVYESKAITPDKKRLLIDKLDKGVVDLSRVMVGQQPLHKAILSETVGLAEQYISSK